MTVVLFHAGSVSVVETTYFGRAFIRSPMGIPARPGHTAAKLSYVCRPISTASLFSSSRSWMSFPFSPKPPVEGQFWGFWITPSRVT